jgi:DNA/RNA-binding domain of Phe-tRNA-synthetase-like protein
MPTESAPSADRARVEPPGFGYDDAVLERFPTIRAGVIHATSLDNTASASELPDRYRIEQQAVSQRLSEVPIAMHPSITAWRRVFTAFGAKPTQHRNAAEALLRRLDKRGDIPSISTLVDIGNLVSIRYSMPVAVVDAAQVADPITVRFADGTEPFADLGSSESVHPEPGEVVFVDGDGVVCARRWCWRQSAQSATGPDTTGALYVVEGHHDTAEDDIREALDLLLSLLAAHQPGATTTAYALSPATPSVEDAVSSASRHSVSGFSS